MEYILPIGIFIVFGIVFGVLLTVISKVFAVKVDERAQKITETLPGANCGACGYAGCADYADAIVNKGASMNACLPGGAAAASKSVKSWVLQLPQQNGKFRWFTATALAKQPSRNLHLMAFKPVLLRSDSTAVQEAVCMDV